MQLTPYLMFDGRADEAIAFYKAAVAAEVPMLMRFGDAPPGAEAPQMDKNKVMHAELRIGESKVFVTDGGCEGGGGFSGFSLTLSLPDVAATERAFTALAEGGTVRMPLAKTFFSPSFGMLTDRFGVSWTIIVMTAPPG